MMHENWSELINMLRPALKELRGGAPEVMKAFSAVAQAALAPKALDTKTKELIAVAISVAIR
jgi:alkylhydroperoxidase/carboxymuconolactone decarboxylase family protein YurZ